MTDIPNTEYVTLKYNDNYEIDVFVGGKPATHYLGYKIYNIRYVKLVFGWIKNKNSFISEFHIMMSETSGEYAKTGNPSEKHGGYVWCRVKFYNGQTSLWVYNGKFGFTTDPNGQEHGFANSCAFEIRSKEVFRSAVLAQKPQTSINPVVVAGNNNTQNKR